MILEEIKMVEDTPDDLVHELFTQHFWEGHPLGRPILGSKETVESFTDGSLREYFRGAYVAPNMIVSAAGNLEHAAVRELVERAFAELPATRRAARRNSRRGRAAGASRAPRSSSRATSASAPTAIRRTTTIATSATS